VILSSYSPLRLPPKTNSTLLWRKRKRKRNPAFKNHLLPKIKVTTPF
jgi:hypothetical protein